MSKLLGGGSTSKSSSTSSVASNINAFVSNTLGGTAGDQSTSAPVTSTSSPYDVQAPQTPSYFSDTGANSAGVTPFTGGAGTETTSALSNPTNIAILAGLGIVAAYFLIK